MSRYPRDPYWLTAKFPSACSKCKAPIRKGDQAWYWPNGRKIECATCGEDSSRRFSADMFDEVGY